MPGARGGESHFAELRGSEEPPVSDGSVFGGVGTLFVVGFGAQLRRAVAVGGEAAKGFGGFSA